MKKIPALVFVTFVVLFGIAGNCKKGGGGGGGGGGTTEANLAITLNPPANSLQAPALGPNFPLTVTITSTMPPQGVTINVSAKIDGSTAAPFYTSGDLVSSTSLNNFSITGTPAATTALVTVVVTSRTKATNTYTGTYRYARK